MIPLRDNIRSKSFAWVSYMLIAINLYIFYLELTAGSPAKLEMFIRHWALVPKLFYADPGAHWHTMITAMFFHGGWIHLISNMLFLFIFGDNVEDRMGHRRYLVFYLLTGVAANLAQAHFTPQSAVPLIGASGAIAGVLGAYFFYFPHAEVDTLIPIFFFITIRTIPAFIFLGYWFVLQMFSSALSITTMASEHSIGGIAFIAHAAGFIAGLMGAPIFGKKAGRFK